MEAIVTLVSTVGFPIAMCLLVYFQNTKEIDSLRDAINNNTLVMQKILDKLGMEENGK